MKKGIPNTSIAIFLLLGLSAGRAAGAGKESIPVPPPMAKPSTVTAYLGRSTEIPLALGGRIVEPLSILIRKQPGMGTLGGLLRTGRSSAVIVYTPDPKAGPGSDTFSFAAKSADSPVSAAAVIHLQLIDEPPRVIFPQELEFGTVFLGDSLEKEIVVRNAGGGTATRELAANPPWRFSGSDKYRLSGGSEAVLKLTFTPTEERDYRDGIQIAPGPGDVLAVRGSGAAPVSWDKEGIVITPKMRQTGKAGFVLANKTAQDRKITIEWPEGLRSTREIAIASGGSADLELEVTASPQANIQGEARVLSGNFQGTIPIRIFPAPPKIEVVPDQVLKLSGTAKDRFVVKNTGGSDATLDIAAPAGIHLDPDPANVLLHPGQEQGFDVRPGSSKENSWNIKIQAPECPSVDLLVQGPGTKRPKSSVPVENFLGIPKGPAETGELPPVPTEPVRRQEGPVVVSAGLHEIHVNWRIVGSEVSAFRVERRSLSPGPDGGILQTWIPWQGGVLSVTDGVADARLVRLPSNRRWTIRIVPLDARGNPLPPSPPALIATVPEPKMQMPWWGWLGLIAALAWLATLVWRKHQKRLLAGENERIARLERK